MLEDFLGDEINNNMEPDARAASLAAEQQEMVAEANALRSIADEGLRESAAPSLPAAHEVMLAELRPKVLITYKHICQQTTTSASHSIVCEIEKLIATMLS